MLDYTSPVAKRTRLREAQAYKEYYDKKKKEERIKSVVAESPRAFKVGGFECYKRTQVSENSNGLGSEYIAVSNGSDDNDDFEDLGVKKKENGKMGVEGIDDRVQIVVDDSDDDVVCLGERGDFGAKKGENLFCIDVDNEGALSDRELEGKMVNESDHGFDFDDRKSSSGDEISEEDSDELETMFSGEDRGRSEGEKENRVEVGVKRKKAYGLDILVDSENDNDDCDNVSPEVDCVAKRTRSHFSESEKKMKFVTMSRTICVDEEELESLSGHDDGDDNEIFHNVKKTKSNDGKTGSKEGNDDNERKLRKVTKRRLIRAPKNHDVVKILADSILDKREVPLEDEVSKEEICQPVTDIVLPSKFTFGVEEPTPPEKSEYEKELDKIWDEMNFALKSSEIGFTDPAMIKKNEDNVSPEIELDTATLCHQGIHKLTLDEEIGIICKLCSYVELEIRYIVPSFSTHPCGKPNRRDYGRVDQSIFNELQNQDSCCDSQSGSDPYADDQGTVWDIMPGIKNTMFFHQREGFEFIWNNIAGGIYHDNLKDPTSFDHDSGCIISHAPGTGKTRLTIVFLQTYMKKFPMCRPVIIAPKCILDTWEEEFQKWKVDIPFHNLKKTELSGKENMAAVSFLKRVKHGERNVHSIRVVKLYSWKKEKSILGISYRLFEELVGEDRRTKSKRKTEDEQVRKILLEIPGLFVFDEGHTPRNDQTLMWKALSKIKTKKRIILSGTPFQNNFDELLNTLCLVRPKFADTISSRNHGGLYQKHGRKRNEERGKWTTLTSSIGKFTGDRHESVRIKELRDMIAPFVHVHKGNILQQSLPGLRHSMVVLQPTPVQKRLLEGALGIRNMFMLDCYVSLVSVHPSLLPFEKVESLVDRDMLEGLRLNPEAGVKTKFLMELLRLSEAINEKVLVFSQYIEPLICIRDQLKSQFNWTEGNEVLYIDGKCHIKQRQSSINVFNDPKSEAKVMLASIKACSEGISLVGASRVVLLDVAWNPSVERQAISRAYRIGQKKVVYIYHLVTSGTMEEEKWGRQAGKDRLSDLLFSSSNKGDNQQKITSIVSEDKILEEMVQHEKLKHMFRKIIYQPKESDLIDTFGLVEL